jgi:hypothetical protein
MIWNGGLGSDDQRRTVKGPPMEPNWASSLLVGSLLPVQALRQEPAPLAGFHAHGGFYLPLGRKGGHAAVDNDLSSASEDAGAADRRDGEWTVPGARGSWEGGKEGPGPNGSIQFSIIDMPMIEDLA